MATSVLLIISYFSGLFTIQLSFTDTFPINKIDPIIYGESSVVSTLNKKQSICTTTNAREIDVCGASFNISKGDGKGVDLSIYNEFSIKMKISWPKNEPKIKLTLRHFDPNFSTPTQLNIPKYNGVMLSENDWNTANVLPIDFFQVESWWIREYKVPIEYSRFDISNVIAFDIVHYDVTAPGDYIVEIENLTFYGQIISPTQFVSALAVIWLTIIFLMFARHRSILEHRAVTDHLTKISNRNGLTIWSKSIKPNVNKPCLITLIYMDVDDFKSINDTYGHAVGDEVLIAFSNTVSTEIKGLKLQNGIFVRLSGDEFLVALVNETIDTVEIFTQSLLKQLAKPLQNVSSNIKVGVSIGIVQERIVDNDLQDAFNKADAAMYWSKRAGKNKYKIFDDEVAQNTLLNKNISKTLRYALDNDQFYLNFMPIFDLESRQVQGVEVLLRSDNEILNNLGPDSFIQIAEESNLVIELDSWVMENTFKVLDKHRHLIETLGINFSINVSTLDLKTGKFYAFVSDLLYKYNVPPNWIDLEITETAFETRNTQATNCIKSLHEKGLSVTLDDFGTGYTALNQLVEYPVDGIKIDKIFIKELLNESQKQNKILVKSMIAIAKAHKLEVTAEGVESLEQFYCLKELGCDKVQGSLYSLPLNLNELAKALRNQVKTKV